MDDTMPKNDFLKPLLDLMNRRMDGLEKKIDDNSSLTQQALDEVKATNGTVEAHGHDIKAIQHALSKVEKKSGRKFDISPSVLYLIALGAVILLMTIATILHVNLGGLFK